jgi:hypothetical protein
VNMISVEFDLCEARAVAHFCRAFSITAAIERFDLPYTHVGGNRWTYTAGSRPGEAIVSDNDTRLNDCDGTSPAFGRHNAFDLVRLHWFRGTFIKEKPIAERLSRGVMVEFALDQPEIKALQLARNREISRLCAASSAARRKLESARHVQAEAEETTVDMISVDTQERPNDQRFAFDEKHNTLEVWWDDYDSGISYDYGMDLDYINTPEKFADFAQPDDYKWTGLTPKRIALLACALRDRFNWKTH